MGSDQRLVRSKLHIGFCIIENAVNNFHFIENKTVAIDNVPFNAYDIYPTPS